MTKQIKLIGFDLDDTALNRKKQLTPVVKAAIEKAIQAGIVVLPATGRALAGIPEEVMAIKGIQYALTSNGAKVFSIPARKIVFEDCFSLTKAEEIWRQICTFECSAAMYIDGDAYTETKQFKTLIPHVSEHVREYLENSRTVVPDMLKSMWEKGQPVEKITVYFENLVERQAAWQAIDARGDVCITSSVAANMEINTPTANKGVGLLALAESLGIAKENVMAVGDNSNDIEMLQMVGYGVAMANAEDSVKKLADMVTASCEEDGLARAIESIL